MESQHEKKHNLLKLLKRRNRSYKTSRFSGTPWSPAQVSFLRCDQSLPCFYEQVCLVLCDWLVQCGSASGFLSTQMRQAFNLQKDHAPSSVSLVLGQTLGQQTRISLFSSLFLRFSLLSNVHHQIKVKKDDRQSVNVSFVCSSDHLNCLQ